MIKAYEPNIYALTHICANLRADDKTEIYPLLPYDSHTLLTDATWRACEAGEALIIWCDGVPCAVVGLHPVHGKACWQVFAFGTDDWDQAIFCIMRSIRQCIRKVCDKYPEAIRMQADSHELHTSGHAFISALKGVKEAEMPYYGRDGATYYRYRWLRNAECFQRFIA